MIRKTFTYSRLKIILIWMIALSAPFIWYVPELLEFLKNPYYWIINTLIICGLVYILWAVMERLPGTSKTGTYWKEDGITVIEYGKHKVCLSDVTEVCLCKSPITRRVILLIKNNDDKIKFLSKGLEENYSMEDTDFYLIYAQVLAENSHLVQEKDVWGEPIEYWYKHSKD